MTAAEILRAAAASLAPETWCQDRYCREDGEGGCALWHLDTAGVGHDHALREAKEAVYQDVGWQALADFNDAADTDLYDVRDLFERTAQRLEATCSARS